MARKAKTTTATAPTAMDVTATAAAAAGPAPETIMVRSHRIACDGVGGALGHPRVWLTIARDTGWVECGYCDRLFILDPKAKPKSALESAAA